MLIRAIFYTEKVYNFSFKN